MPLTFLIIIKWLAPIAVWGVISIISFFVFDPRLWIDPYIRLRASLGYSLRFARSEHVLRYGYPFWQPFVWLFVEKPNNSNNAFYIFIDMYIALLAILGFYRLWRKHLVFAIWLFIALIVLLVWPTKWPQYILVLTAPLSLSAAVGFQGFFLEPLINLFGRLKKRSTQT